MVHLQGSRMQGLGFAIRCVGIFHWTTQSLQKHSKCPGLTVDPWERDQVGSREGWSCVAPILRQAQAQQVYPI
jgi:hypothetical protein